MGEYQQSLVDEKATAAQVRELAQDTIEWLIEGGIILAQRADCIPGEDAGYPPGPNWRDAVVAGGDDGFLGLRDNGLEVITERTVFHSWLEGLVCPRCSAEQPDEAAWLNAVDQWWEGDDEASAECVSCGGGILLLDWTSDWPWGFGSFGLTFWNWPNLSESFVAKCSARVGHPLQKVVFKL